MITSKENVQSVDCPRCKAPVGEDCQGASGPRAHNHAERVNAYAASVRGSTLSATQVREVVCPTCGARPTTLCTYTRVEMQAVKIKIEAGEELNPHDQTVRKDMLEAPRLLDSEGRTVSILKLRPHRARVVRRENQ